MLIEIKSKVRRNVDGKVKTFSEGYLLNAETFSEAAENIEVRLCSDIENCEAEEFDIQSIKLSSIKEVYNNYGGAHAFIATLVDTFTDDNSNEKKLRYKILLWADDLTQCNTRVHELARQGYDMKIEGIKETDLVYIE